jgi:hypothetical protein
MNTDSGSYNEALRNYFPMTVDMFVCVRACVCVCVCFHRKVFFKKRMFCVTVQHTLYIVFGIYPYTVYDILTVCQAVNHIYLFLVFPGLGFVKICNIGTI